MISSCPNSLHADVSDGADLFLHQQEVTGRQLVTGKEFCARYSKFQCDIRVKPLLPLPFTYGEGVLRGQQPRPLCLETELEIRKKEKVCSSLSLSVLLGKGDRVGTRLRDLQGVGHVVEVCLEGCYVG